MCSLTHLDSQVRRPTHLLYISCLSFPLFLTFWVHNLVLFHPDLTRYLRDVTADPLQKLQPLASSRCTYGFNVPVRLSLIFLENIGRMQRNVLSKVRKGLEGRKVSFGWMDGRTAGPWRTNRTLTWRARTCAPNKFSSDRPIWVSRGRYRDQFLVVKGADNRYLEPLRNLR